MEHARCGEEHHGAGMVHHGPFPRGDVLKVEHVSDHERALVQMKKCIR